MKLYEIPKGSRIKTTLTSGKEAIINFFHIDGMYSYCTIDDGDADNVIHLSAMTPLKKEGEFYTIEHVSE
jgi:hypothetical protein